MKYLLYSILAFLTAGQLLAQSNPVGYYISHSQDTISAEFKLKKGVFGQLNNDFTEEIEIIISSNEAIKFTPNDILGYAFTWEGKNYHFVSKPTQKEKKKFLVPVVLGPKTNLYQYGVYTSGGLGGSNQVFYTFEKSDGSYLFLTNRLNKKFKAELKSFYYDSPEAFPLIDERLQYWLELQKDLVLILNYINSL